MKNAFAVFASSIALLGAQPALAGEAYIIPDAVTPWVFEGIVTFNQGVTLLCNATIELSGPNDAPDISPQFDHTDLSNLGATITLSGGLFGICSGVTVQPVLPGDISYAGGTFTFTNVDIFFTSSCSGTLTGVWNEGVSPQTLTVSLSSGCTMGGALDLVGPSSGNAVGVLDGDHDRNHP